MDKFFTNDEINMTKFNVNYCPLLILIDHHRKTLESEFRNIGFRKQSNTFFSTMRHILDAKYNDILVTSDPKLYIRFPDFIYSWLMNFIIDNSSKKLRFLTGEEVRKKKNSPPFLL